jgi:hypothetical protein
VDGKELSLTKASNGKLTQRTPRRVRWRTFLILIGAGMERKMKTSTPVSGM